MNKNKQLLLLAAGSLFLASIACGEFSVGVESQNFISIESEDSQMDDLQSEDDPGSSMITTSTDTSAPPDVEDSREEEKPGSKRYRFDQLGISLEIPQELCVIKDPNVKYEDVSKVESYLIYIQNYGCPGGPSSGDFQIYGHLQYSLFPMTWEEFSNNQMNSPNNAYANYIEIGGLRGYDTQLNGPRNRFVYHFFLEGYDLSFSVAEPSVENKATANEIIYTLEYTPNDFSNQSHLQSVTDVNQLFQFLIPEDWDYAQQPTVGLQLSSLEASSPDLEVVLEDGGPHDNIFYKSGISLNVQVIDEEIEHLIQWPDTQEYQVYFDGIIGTVYTFTEPSTAEGEIRTVLVYHEGKTYLFRFGYADDADTDSIDQIIASFNLNSEFFFPSP